MKIIENYCRQPRAYADSEGLLIIELEPGDDKEAIIKQYTHKPEGWWDGSCTYSSGKSTENKLVFLRWAPFLD